MFPSAYGAPPQGFPPQGAYGAPAQPGFSQQPPASYAPPFPQSYNPPGSGPPAFNPQQGMFQANLFASSAPVFNYAQGPPQNPPYQAYGHPGPMQPQPQQYGAPHGFPSAFPSASATMGPSFHRAGPSQMHPSQYQPGPAFPMAPAPGRPQGLSEAVLNEARRLRSAMRGLGTSDAEVVAILSSHDNRDMTQIAQQYYSSFGRKLEDALASDLSGNYKHVAVAVAKERRQYEAELIYDATHGAKDAECVLEILCTRTPQELQEIRAAYANPVAYPGEKFKHRAPGANMNDDILAATSGKIKRLCHTLLMQPRPSTPANPAAAGSDADFLIKAAKGLGTDEVAFFEVLATRSYAHLRMVANEVERRRGKTLERLICSEFSRLQKRALLYILDCALKGPEQAYARIVRFSVKGAGTRDAMLIRTICARYDVDMPRIRAAYSALYSRDLVRDVQSDTSFNYRKLLTGLMDFQTRRGASQQ